MRLKFKSEKKTFSYKKIKCIIIFILLWFLYSSCFTKSMIVGTYVIIGDGTERRSSNGDIIKDTLFLFPDGTFKETGRKWFLPSKGIYKVGIPFLTEIEFEWYEKAVKAMGSDISGGFVGWSTRVTRIWFSRIRIPIDIDLGIYYEKID